MITTPAPKKTFMQKQIPTLLGIGVLVVALIAGVYFVGTGPGVFAPRATPETTPTKIKLTNITDSSFTVSFMTSSPVAGFVKYGTEADSLKSQASDDRDQLSGTIGDFQLHHITVRGLKPNTKYFYVLGTGARNEFDNNGQAFSVTTSQRAGAPTAAKTAYGTILQENGSPADGAVVYVALDGVGEMSSLVKSSGSWAIPLSNARKTDGTGFAEVTDDTQMSLQVQGSKPTQMISYATTVGASQPVAALTFGQTPVATEPEPTQEPEVISTGEEEATMLETDDSLDTPTETPATGGLDSLITTTSLDSSAENTSSATESAIVDLNATEKQTVADTDPIIKGTAAPNVTVSIEVNSETQIQQQLTADANGNFELDIEALKKNLEPGEHSATYSYTDPATGKVVTKTVNFTVEEPTQQLAQATGTNGSTTGGPYSSGNPYPVGTSPSPTASASATASPSATPVATESGKGGTSTRSGLPSTSSAIPVSGSVGTTLALVIGGLFFLIAGGWSYWIGQTIKEED